MSIVGRVHSSVVFGRRVQVLAGELSDLVGEGGTLVDVGCGDGSIGRSIADLRPDLDVYGFEVLVRPGCRIPVKPFDGTTIPLDDASVDFAMLVDVLHHTDEPSILLAEAARVARRAVLLKDHTVQGLFARKTLRFMDWFGNAHHGVVLPYNYWSAEQWSEAFDGLALVVEERRDELPLYPFPASLVFGRRLHFVARLEPR